MKVVYHLGWHKTGSTYLQEFFARNAAHLLREHSILYPLSGRRGRAHHRLFVRSPESGINFRSVSDEWPDFLGELADAGGSVRNALISTESMQALSPEAVGALTGGAFLETAQAEAIAYLRRHDQFVESQFAERIKFGIHLPWAETYAKMLRRGALYTDHLGRIRSNEKLARFILRPFAPDRWKNRNLVDDFFEHAFGVSVEGELELPRERNPSPDPRVLHLLDRFHREWKGESLLPRIIKLGIVAPLGAALQRVGLAPEKPVFLAPEERIELLKAFTPEIEKLAQWTDGVIDFAADDVAPKMENREQFENPAADEVRGILESYLDPEFFSSAWEAVPKLHRPKSHKVRGVFQSLLASQPGLKTAGGGGVIEQRRLGSNSGDHSES